MNKVIILVEGYALKLPGGRVRASPSTVLIQTPENSIIVDPGANSELLCHALSEKHLVPDTIDAVFLTHYHLDHVLNIRLFPGKDIYDGRNIYRRDEEIPYTRLLPNTDVEVVHTPGHTEEHASLIVPTEDGRCAVAGDVFWWWDTQEQMTDGGSLRALQDEYAQDATILLRSRDKLLKMADFIVPGHGRPFKVTLGHQKGPQMTVART